MSTKKRSSHRNFKSPKSSLTKTPFVNRECLPVHTAGEAFCDGASIELIGEAPTGPLCLMLSDGQNVRVARQVEFRGKVYQPVPIDPSILLAMRFPTKRDRFGSTAELFTEIRNTFMSYGFPEDMALAIAHFNFATWFTEFLPAAPCLLLTGPPAEARLVLELQGCMVRRPLPLGQIPKSGLCSLPMYLQPTLLIHQIENRGSAWELLNISNHPCAYIARTQGLVNVYCAKAVYLGGDGECGNYGDSVLRINLPSLRGRFPILDAKDQLKIFEKFQSKMLDYRCRNILKVRESICDFPEFDSGIRILGRILGAPLVDAPELQADLEPLLRERQEEIQAAKWLDLHCVTLEAVLRHCHENPENKVHVLGITKTVNLIYKGRGQTTEFEPEVIGHILRLHKFSPKRDRHGYYILLDDQTRRHAHLAARRRGVAAVQVGISKCSLCSEILATDGTRTFSDSRSKGQKL